MANECIRRLVKISIEMDLPEEKIEKDADSAINTTYYRELDLSKAVCHVQYDLRKIRRQND